MPKTPCPIWHRFTAVGNQQKCKQCGINVMSRVDKLKSHKLLYLSLRLFSPNIASHKQTRENIPKNKKSEQC